MAATDARPVPRKNVAFRATLPIYDADGDLVTAAAGLDSEVSKDGGTFADCTNEATEIATSSGLYFLDLTASEMNADTSAVIVKTTTSGAKTTALVFYPEEIGDVRADVQQWVATAPNALVSGRVDSTVGAMQADVVTAAAIATDAIGASEFAQGAADKIWASTTRTLSALSTALAQSVWDVLESAIAVASSIGLKVKTNVDAAITTRLAPTVAARTLDVSAGGEAGVDWANVGSPTTVVGLSGTTVKTATDVETDTQDIQARLPAALVGGRMDASVGGMGADVVTASALAADAAQEIADALLKRDLSAVSGEAARSLLNAIRKLMNKWAISGSTLTVYKENDTDAAYTQAITTTPGADPVTSLDTV
jgi:hypothetical protein